MGSINSLVALSAVRDGELINSMAADLRRFQATANESDAIRALIGRYAPRDLARLFDDALFAARLQVIVAEMRVAS